MLKYGGKRLQNWNEVIGNLFLWYDNNIPASCDVEIDKLEN